MSNFTPTTRNVTRLFRKATLEQIVEGAAWYSNAYQIASTFASRYNVPVSVAAGVIAAVSPLNSWGANVRLAERIIAAGGLDAGYLKVGLDKAKRILKGESVLDVLKSDKVSNFYLSIITAGAEGVCVDRHAFSLAVNHRFVEGNIPGLSGKRYAATAECYTRAAAILSKEYGMPISAAQVQSVTWVLWKNLYWAEGAFDLTESEKAELVNA